MIAKCESSPFCGIIHKLGIRAVYSQTDLQEAGISWQMGIGMGCGRLTSEIDRLCSLAVILPVLNHPALIRANKANSPK